MINAAVGGKEIKNYNWKKEKQTSVGKMNHKISRSLFISFLPPCFVPHHFWMNTDIFPWS